MFQTETLGIVEKALCLIGNASNSLSVLRRYKVLYAINPKKVSLAKFFSCKLAKYHSRSVYFKCSLRFQNLFSSHACSVSSTSSIRSKLNNQKRNCIATKKGGNTTSPFQPRWFLPQIVSCSEKRRRPEAGVKFEVPMYPDSQKFLRFLLGDKAYEITAMPSGLNEAPRLFTKIMKPVVASLRSQGVRLINLSRRHFNHSFFNRDVESPQNTSHQLARIPRFSNKLREVESNSIPTNCVRGNAGGFGVNAIHITSTEICTDSKRMLPSPKHKFQSI